MEIIILLIAILLLSRIKNVNEKTEFKIVVASIMGISFFFIWPYVYYATQLLSWSETTTYISYLVLLSMAMGLVLVIAMVRVNVFVPVLAIVAFVVCWSVSYLFDIQIKHSLADSLGYFNADRELTEKMPGVEYRDYQSLEGNYTISVPANWKQQSYKSIGLIYFTADSNKNSRLEFRPKCFHPIKTSMSEITQRMVFSATEEESVTTQCYHWNNDGYACKINIGLKEGQFTGPARIRWLGYNYVTTHAVELDFVLQSTNKAELQLIDSMIDSVRLNQFEKNEQGCVSVTEWY